MADAVGYLVSADQPRPRATQYVLCTMGDMDSLVVLIAIALVCVGLVILVKYIIEL
jgi:hypothetical protein